MSLDRAILAFAGAMVLLSVALTVWVSPHFVWFTVFIGLNLLQSAFTGVCLAQLADQRAQICIAQQCNIIASYFKQA